MSMLFIMLSVVSEQEQDKAQEQLRRERELRRKKEEEDSLTLEQTKEQVIRSDGLLFHASCYVFQYFSVCDLARAMD